MTTQPPDKQPAAETLEQVAGRIVATLQERNNIILPDAGRLTESILSALRNERERCAKVLDKEIALLRSLRHPTSYAKWKREELERLAEAIRGGE